MLGGAALQKRRPLEGHDPDDALGMNIGRRSFIAHSATLAFGTGACGSRQQQKTEDFGQALAQQPGLVVFATVSDAVKAALPRDALAIWVHGYHWAGDGGSALYLPTDKAPGHGAALTGRDGRIWELSAGSAVRPEQFGARGDVEVDSDALRIRNAGSDDQNAFDRACAYLKSQPGEGGTLTLGAKAYRVTRGVRLERHVSLAGHPGASLLFKSGAESRTVQPAGVADGGMAAAVYPRAALAHEINAVLILDGAGGRWIGRVEGVTLQGGMADAGWESQQVEFGLVSVGSISDSAIRQVTINTVRHAFVLPDVFTTEISVNRANNCLSGFGINKGTSLTYKSNYASNCRDYGHSIRDVIYGHISSNAVDSLNNPILYSDRTRKCRAYIFSALDNVSIVNNGQEQTFGTAYYLDVLNDCTIQNNLLVGLGSDYRGDEHIAVWEMTGYEFNTSITDNGVFSYKASGLLQNGARAQNHHFVYCARDVGRPPARIGFRFERNTVREDRFSRTFGTGWGNSVTLGWSTGVQAGQ